jgi:hypothetical protein
MKKSVVILLIVAAVAVTVSFGCLTMVFTLRSLERENTMWSYLEPYEAEAMDYLRQNQEFVALYGEDVTLEGRNIRYRFTDPKKYTSISLNPQIPASAEEFAAELESLTVSFELPDLRVVTVTFARTPDGTPELTGWEFTEE